MHRLLPKHGVDYVFLVCYLCVMQLRFFYKHVKYVF